MLPRLCGNFSEIYIKQLQMSKKSIDLLEKVIKLPAISDKFQSRMQVGFGGCVFIYRRCLGKVSCFMRK